MAPPVKYTDSSYSDETSSYDSDEASSYDSDEASSYDSDETSCYDSDSDCESQLPEATNISKKMAPPVEDTSNSSDSSYSYETSSSDSDSDGVSKFEFTDISKDEMKMIHSRLPDFIKPTSITKVRNQNLWNKYQLNKEKYTCTHGAAFTELSLWHATSENNADSIVEKNFDFRKTVRCLYGYGVSFATDAGYANFHCNQKAGYNRALILTNVLVGEKCYGYPYMELPTKGCDTAVSKQGTVFVKFNDDEFYPAYVVYYTDSNHMYTKADNTQHAGVPVDI